MLVVHNARPSLLVQRLQVPSYLKPDTHECEWWDVVLLNTGELYGITYIASSFIGVYNCSSDGQILGIEFSK